MKNDRASTSQVQRRRAVQRAVSCKSIKHADATRKAFREEKRPRSDRVDQHIRELGVVSFRADRYRGGSREKRRTMRRSAMTDVVERRRRKRSSRTRVLSGQRSSFSVLFVRTCRELCCRCSRDRVPHVMSFAIIVGLFVAIVLLIPSWKLKARPSRRVRRHHSADRSITDLGEIVPLTFVGTALAWPCPPPWASTQLSTLPEIGFDPLENLSIADS